ncbi:hypothetical protein CLU83_4642 [Flavobacterium sp. 1]|uniref:hypothetical protein n=1 Tax=Flavobacterium sp. 1 TaxID=2035200 RepID=UPI000C23A805|nr:hypothetical protein [Flavobacterium sp. 1]PJJ11146.1 hypothetical protein CLU83_4642 [Flavobacterium sp. 1]
MIKCGSSNKLLNTFREEKVIISYGKDSSTKNPSFTFNSNDKKLICIGFLDKFNDTIITYLNEKKKITFYRKDSLSYKNLKHEEIFKFVKTNKKKNNRVTIFLKRNKKKISFNLINNKKLYLVSHYGDTWYLTIWD